MDEEHAWSPGKNGYAISPLLQSHYLRFEAELVPATASSLLNEALGKELTNKSQGRRLLEAYGRDEAVVRSLITPLSRAEQKPVLQVVKPADDPVARDVIYAMFDGLMLPYDEGYQETKIGRVFLGRHLVKSGAKPNDRAEKLNERRRVENSEYLACEGHYTNFTQQFTPLVRAVQKREGPAISTIVITDGAAWMADYVKRELPQAIHILDFFHAFEHLADFAKVTWPDNRKRQPILDRWAEELRAAKVDQILEESNRPTNPRCYFLACHL